MKRAIVIYIRETYSKKENSCQIDTRNTHSNPAKAGLVVSCLKRESCFSATGRRKGQSFSNLINSLLMKHGQNVHKMYKNLNRIFFIWWEEHILRKTLQIFLYFDHELASVFSFFLSYFKLCIYTSSLIILGSMVQKFYSG